MGLVEIERLTQAAAPSFPRRRKKLPFPTARVSIVSVFIGS